MKDQFLRIRCTATEKAAWEAKATAAGISLSGLMRRSMDRVRTWTARNRQAEQERSRQLKRVGINLNQITRWANTYKGAADTVQVLAQLRAIERALEALSVPPEGE